MPLRKTNNSKMGYDIKKDKRTGKTTIKLLSNKDKEFTDSLA